MKKNLPIAALILMIAVIGSFLLARPFLKSRNSPSPARQNLPVNLVSPAVSNSQQIIPGQPYRLTEKGALLLFAKVKKINAHPKNSDEYQLFLTTDGKGPEIEKIPFTIRPILEGDKEAPGRETFIYHSRISAQGEQEQVAALISDLTEGALVSITYKINPENEVFVISLGIQT